MFSPPAPEENNGVPVIRSRHNNCPGLMERGGREREGRGRGRGRGREREGEGQGERERGGGEGARAIRLPVTHCVSV